MIWSIVGDEAACGAGLGDSLETSFGSNHRSITRRSARIYSPAYRHHEPYAIGYRWQRRPAIEPVLTRPVRRLARETRGSRVGQHHALGRETGLPAGVTGRRDVESAARHRRGSAARRRERVNLLSSPVEII